MTSVSGFYIPPVSLFGEGAIEEAAKQIREQEFKNVLIVTDPGIAKIGLSGTVSKILD